ncbi:MULTISPECIES: hypothetical protein [Emticicia]|uniref:hypothetical protein n=1 Tax=Emticicia TaxID=312278 RepID=UPI000C7754DD|nr:MULTISPECIES: hypothetical protein [Emticicia]PLK45249.1 hypothetical protein C0V77_08470 [Emticicia sp. TH156]UTA67241.1 hypothetical protein MB380_16730 [Emticicia sp. 21SJ11W-3]
MGDLTTKEDLSEQNGDPAKRDSAALKRVKRHTYVDLDEGPNGTEKTRQEGLYLSLDQMEILISYLRKNHPNIDHVSFMIGKLSSKEGRSLQERAKPRVNEEEYTVEILPFQFKKDGNSEFLTVDNVVGFLTIPGQPFDNEMGGGGGGNQKVPPPSVRTP